MRVQVARKDAARVLHLHGGGKAFAAGGRTAVEHAHPGRRAGGERRELCRRVLHVDRAGLEQRQRLEIARPGDEETAGQPRVRFIRDLRLVQRGGYLLRRGDQGVTLQGGLRDVVVSGKEGLERFFVHGRAQAVDERLGVGIFCREVLRRGERVLLPRERAQRAVDQPGGALVGIGLCLFDGLIDGGGNGDLVQKQDLIRAEAQNIEHDRLQLCKRRGDHLRQIKVQQQPVLHHAIHEPRGQRRVAAAEAVAGDILFECAVGPGILPPDGDKRRKRGRSCVHRYLVEGFQY